MRVAQRLEALGRERRDQSVLRPEVAVGRGLGDAGPPGGLAQGEGRGALLLHERQRLVQEVAAQVAVVVRALLRRVRLASVARARRTIADGVDRVNAAVAKLTALTWRTPTTSSWPSRSSSG